jgi:hypothetical protein
MLKERVYFVHDMRACFAVTQGKEIVRMPYGRGWYIPVGDSTRDQY